MLEIHKTIKMSHLVPCQIYFLLLLFFERGWQGVVFKDMKNNHFFSVFSCMCAFPRVNR